MIKTFKIGFSNFSQSFISFSILAGLMLAFIGLFWGTAKIIEFIYPCLIVLGGISLIVFILIVFPCSLITRYRQKMILASLLISNFIGAITWGYSFIILFQKLGWWSILSLTWSQAVNFFAIAVLGIKGEWTVALQILFAAASAYGIKYYAMYLETIQKTQVKENTTKKQNFDYVDAEFISSSEIIDEQK